MPSQAAAVRAEPTVFVIDDDAGVRDALDTLLRSVGYTVLCFSEARGFLDSGAAAQPGCLVSDVRLPGLGGLDLQDELGRRGSSMPVVLITGFGDIPMTVRGMKAGAVDFLAKPFRDQDLLDAVAVALVRDAGLRRSAAARDEICANWSKLSDREKEVARLVADGSMNKQVAHVLDISEITVKTHRGNAMRKLGLRTLADLVRLVEQLPD